MSPMRKRAFQAAAALALGIAVAAVSQFERRGRAMLASDIREDLVLAEVPEQFCQPGGMIKSNCVYFGPPTTWTAARFVAHCAAIDRDIKDRGIPERLVRTAQAQYRLRCTGYKRLKK